MQLWPCKKDSCINAEERTNMKVNYTAGTKIAFGQHITYSCETGTFFSHDKNEESFSVECLTTGEFDYPTEAEWPECVSSKLVNKLCQISCHKTIILLCRCQLWICPNAWWKSCQLWQLGECPKTLSDPVGLSVQGGQKTHWQWRILPSDTNHTMPVEQKVVFLSGFTLIHCSIPVCLL